MGSTNPAGPLGRRRPLATAAGGTATPSGGRRESAAREPHGVCACPRMREYSTYSLQYRLSPGCTQQLRHSHPPLHLTFWEGSPPTAQTSSKGSGRGRPGRFEVTDLGQAPHPGPFSTSHFPYRSTPALRPPSASNSTARGHAPPPAQLEASGQRAARRTVNGRRDARAAESTASTLSIKTRPPALDRDLEIRVAERSGARETVHHLRRGASHQRQSRQPPRRAMA